jgi:hypothetical protein
LLCSLYEDCSKAIIKKSLNLAAKGYKVVKKDEVGSKNHSPLPRRGDGSRHPLGFTYMPSPLTGEGKGEGEIQN